MYPSENRLSRFQDAYDNLSVLDESLSSFVEIIREGSYRDGRGALQRFGRKIAKLRGYLAAGNKKSYNTNKKKLLAVTLGGIFREGKHDQDLTQYSGLVHVDLDKLTVEQMDSYREILEKDSFVLVVFSSPSGRGLKVIGWHPLGSEHHESVYWVFRSHVQQLVKCLDETMDDSVRNLSRLCFVSHDPSVYLNLEASPMVSAVEELGQRRLQEEIPPPEPEKKPKSLFDASKHQIFDDGKSQEQYALAVLDAACEKIRAAAQGEKHQTRLLRARVVAGFVAGGSLEEGLALERLISAALQNTDDPKLAEKDIRDGFEHGKQEPLEVPDPDPQFFSGGLGGEGPKVRQADPDMDEKLKRLRGVAEEFASSSEGEEGQEGEGSEQSEETTESKPNPLLSFDDFVAGMAAPEFLVRDMMETDSFVTLIGDPGAGKSFLALSWGLAVASGLDWLGKPVKQGPVYYFAGEGKAGMKRRMMAWKEHHHGANPGNSFRVLSGGWDLSRRETVDALYLVMCEVVEKEGAPSLIVVDTLARHFGANNENDTQSMNTFVSYMDLIRKQFGCTILVVHHTGKDKERGGRGSTVLHGAVDCSYLLEKSEDSGGGGGGGKMTLKCLKMKDAEMPGHQHYGLKTVQIRRPDGHLLVQDDGVTPVTSAVLFRAEAAEDGGDDDGVEIPIKKPKEYEKKAYEAFLELWEIGKQNLLEAGRDLADLSVDPEEWSRLCQSPEYGLSKYNVYDVRLNRRGAFSFFHDRVRVVKGHLIKIHFDGEWAGG